MSSAHCSAATHAPTPCVPCADGPGFAKFEVTSQDDHSVNAALGADTFQYHLSTKMFFGTVNWVGSNNHRQLPARVGQDLLLVHIPGHTFKTGGGVTPNFSLPLPLQVDKHGRFGLVIPIGVNHIFVKMYGTLWKKVSFTTGGSQSHNFQTWYGASVDFTKTLDLRYGDVNEDNLIDIDPLNGDRAYLNERTGGAVDVRLASGDAIFKYDYVCDLNRDNKVDTDDGDRDFYDDFLQPGTNLAGAVMP